MSYAHRMCAATREDTTTMPGLVRSPLWGALGVVDKWCTEGTRRGRNFPSHQCRQRGALRGYKYFLEQAACAPDLQLHWLGLALGAIPVLHHLGTAQASQGRPHEERGVGGSHLYQMSRGTSSGIRGRGLGRGGRGTAERGRARREVPLGLPGCGRWTGTPFLRRN